MRKYSEFRSDVIGSQAFLKLTDGAKSLYYALCIFANNMGVVTNREEVLSKNYSNQSDLDTLIESGYVLWRDTDELIIVHWYENNRTPLPTDDANLVGLRINDRKYQATNGFKHHENNKDSDFERLWKAYPKRNGTSKKEARTAFNNVSIPVDVLIAAVEKSKKMESWKNVQYIPALAVWLRQRRWETGEEIDDEVNTRASSENKNSSGKWNIDYDVG